MRGTDRRVSRIALRCSKATEYRCSLAYDQGHEEFLRGAIDVRAVWDTLEQDIPALKSACEAILNA